ncbi:MAG: hypothetical protein WED12_05460 [Chloroflexota bacterium]
MERLGIPTVIIAAAAFVLPLDATARAKGFPALPYVTVPKVYNNLSADEAREQTLGIVGDVLDLLEVDGRAHLVAEGGGDRATRRSVPEQLDWDHDTATPASSRALTSRGWSDGSLVLPPSADEVDRFVARHPDIDPDAELFSMPPGQGVATLRLIAANAVMAGCEPEDLPIVVSCLRAIVVMPDPMRTVGLSSTSAHAPLFVLNGPGREHLGDSTRRNVLGPGTENEVGIRITRAVVMALRNIGQWKPGVLDNDVMGSPRKFGMIVAENEIESPWSSYAQDQGYSPDDDVLTMVVTSGEWDIGFQGQISVDNLIAAIAAKNGPVDLAGYFRQYAGPDHPHEGRMLLISPAHATPIADGGFDKVQLRTRLRDEMAATVRQLREPLRKLAEQGNVREEYRHLFELSDAEASELIYPMIEEVADMRVVVCGSIRGKNAMFPTTGGAVTIPVSITSPDA